MTELIVSERKSFLTLPPREMAAQATEYANVLKDIIEKQGLFTLIGGKKHVRVEGWCTLGSMLGFTIREKYVNRLEDGSYEACVELVQITTGMALGSGSSLCSVQEKRWGTADEFARRSMAITRATGKAYRLNFAWILSIAGYEGTPFEEMPDRPITVEPEDGTYQATEEQQIALSKALETRGVPPTEWDSFSQKAIGKNKRDLNRMLKEVTQNQ